MSPACYLQPHWVFGGDRSTQRNRAVVRAGQSGIWRTRSHGHRRTASKWSTWERGLRKVRERVLAGRKLPMPYGHVYNDALCEGRTGGRRTPPRPSHVDLWLSSDRTIGRVLATQIDAPSWDTVVDRLLGWAHARESRYVAVCNAHVVVTASRNPGFLQVINGADMATPDGASVVWVLRHQGFAGQPRISGTELVRALCRRCAAEDVPVYFYGSTASTLKAMTETLRREFPLLKIAGLECRHSATSLRRKMPLPWHR